MQIETKIENGKTEPKSVKVEVNYSDAEKELRKRVFKISECLRAIGTEWRELAVEAGSDPDDPPCFDPELEMEAVQCEIRDLERALFLFGGDCRWCEIRDGLVHIGDGF